MDKNGLSNEFRGFLFSKLQGFGTKSEGPIYFLQQSDLTELMIEKQTQLWQEDPHLQKYLGSKVKINGKLVSGCLKYEKVDPN